MIVQLLVMASGSSFLQRRHWNLRLKRKRKQKQKQKQKQKLAMIRPRAVLLHLLAHTELRERSWMSPQSKADARGRPLSK